MLTKLITLIIIAALLIGYGLYVLYFTLRKKRKYNKAHDAQELYILSKAPHLLLFGNLFRSSGGRRYKILTEEQPMPKENEQPPK